MKRSILILIALFCSFSSYAQDFYGKATYISRTDIDTGWLPQGEAIPAQQKKSIEDRVKKIGDKTYVLMFNSNESLYKEEKELAAPGTSNRHWINYMDTAMNGEKYKNLENGEWIEQRDMFGKLFLVKDKLPQIEWKITGEKKMIGKYEVIKAVGVKKNSDFKLSSLEREASENTEISTANNEVVNDNDVKAIAWFTPQIPVQQGPSDYTGLPGLILEVTAEGTTILCSQIVINPEKMEKIEPASKGEVVTAVDYNQTFKIKMEEIRQMWRRQSRG